ncbi:hypothetical protein EON66_04675 [archaeon]|nr:MAG: hypothetical protein EON66_04675 [archaeon]
MRDTKWSPPAVDALHCRRRCCLMLPAFLTCSGRYYIESSYPAILRILNRIPIIRAARVLYMPDGSRRVGLDQGA